MLEKWNNGMALFEQINACGGLLKNRWVYSHLDSTSKSNENLWRVTGKRGRTLKNRGKKATLKFFIPF
jgi:hypothetical protein